MFPWVNPVRTPVRIFECLVRPDDGGYSARYRPCFVRSGSSWSQGAIANVRVDVNNEPAVFLIEPKRQLWRKVQC